LAAIASAIRAASVGVSPASSVTGPDKGAEGVVVMVIRRL
jgi:hypothetical protein